MRIEQSPLPKLQQLAFSTVFSSGYHTVAWSNFFTSCLPGDVRWFIDGKLNAADCAVDRWAEMFPDRLAIVWEGDEPTNTQKITYKQLLQEVCQVANLLKLRGVKKGTSTFFIFASRESKNPPVQEHEYSSLPPTTVPVFFQVTP